MYGMNMQQLSIGAVARLTQIPAHTLRKWESRHGIAVPVRSDTGRRVYTEEHVETLRLVKQLVASGHSLGHLAGLDLDALKELAGLHAADTSRLEAQRIALVGPNVSRLLTGVAQVASRFSHEVHEWLAETAALDAQTTYIVESNTLPPELVDALSALRGQAEHLLVVYKFASSETLLRLKDAEVVPVHGPVSEEGLLRMLQPVAAAEAPAVRGHRFSDEELARVAALSPGMECECPNHIAKLLMDITAFEKYSNECVDTDPDERALHQRLGEISARARELFEEALIAVATADGISLSVRE